MHKAVTFLLLAVCVSLVLPTLGQQTLRRSAPKALKRMIKHEVLQQIQAVKSSVSHVGGFTRRLDGFATVRREAPLFTEQCTAAAIKLETDPAFLVEFDKITCNLPIQMDDGHLYVECNTPEHFPSVCKSLASDVCNVTGKGHYPNPDTDKDTLYTWSVPLCVPDACNQQDIDAWRTIFERSKCQDFAFTDCHLAVTCPHRDHPQPHPKSRSFVIFLSISALLIIAAVAAVGAYFVWKHRTATRFAPTTTGEFHEYSELAQYEDEETDIIQDDSGIHNDEEDHTIQ